MNGNYNNQQDHYQNQSHFQGFDSILESTEENENTAALEQADHSTYPNFTVITY